MKELERNLKALANRRRLAILKYLKENRETPVGDIANEINLSFKATSKHLGVLAAVDIVEKKQRSSQVYYRLASPVKSAVRHIVSLL
mgnify:CR=1 FL=1